MAEYNMPQYILREFKVTDARVGGLHSRPSLGLALVLCFVCLFAYVSVRTDWHFNINTAIQPILILVFHKNADIHAKCSEL